MSAAGVGTIQKTGGAAAGAYKTKSQQVGKDGQKAVSPAPKPGELPPNPVAKPDPVPEATQLVTDASDKALRQLEPSDIRQQESNSFPHLPEFLQ